ncbi:hypothetical protein F7725_019914 [Dissostichus mawsoni]|uniref:Uncharacterized protein n=1 Tax=Dissostichus mawsoni TaxID=36200 RepID=A0A7J5YL57_DISMA|nr:hypothetical protein F7725_019914 [Dissostichus mawsoni]
MIIVAVFLDNIDREQASHFRENREPFSKTFLATCFGELLLYHRSVVLEASSRPEARLLRVSRSVGDGRRYLANSDQR